MDKHRVLDRNALQLQQARFAAGIFQAPADDAQLPARQRHGLGVYRRNRHAVAETALAVSYPHVRELMEYRDFRQLVARLLVSHPPTTGDWGEWGAGFAQLIRRSKAGVEFPFLAPIARLDWLCHCAGRAVDTALQQPSLSLLESHSPDNVGIAIAAHVGLVSSTYPLLEIRAWSADRASWDGALQVAESARAVLVFRSQYKVESMYINQPDRHFFQGLMAGRSIGRLLDELAGQDFDFSRWMEAAVSRNLISHFFTI